MKLTENSLKKMILDEMKKRKNKSEKHPSDVKAKEVDASGFANTVDPFDYYKALGLEEKRLHDRLEKINEERHRVLRIIAQNEE